jgi:hypothetical protein
LLACLLACIAPTLLHATEGYDVAVGATATITEFGVCKNVTNNSSNTLWIPTFRAAEWSSFYTNPGQATIAPCAAACAGVSYAGFCWYFAEKFPSCDATCASHGGCNIAGTRDYAGSGGTDAQCAAVMTAAGLTVAGVASGDWGEYTGCMYGITGDGSGSFNVIRDTGAATTCSAVHSAALYDVICACNH